MTPKHMKDRLKFLLSIWIGQPITLKELEKELEEDFGSSLKGEVLSLKKERLIKQDSLTDTFSLSLDGRRELAQQLRRLVDKIV